MKRSQIVTIVISVKSTTGLHGSFGSFGKSEENPPADPVVIEDEDRGKLEEHVKSRSTWIRLLFIAIYVALASIATMALSAVVILGFLVVLFTGETNSQLRAAGQGIASYLYEIIRFLTYNTDDKPFPFGSDWPSPDQD